MRILLDTHAFLWFVTNDSQLSSRALTLIADPTNDILLSPASYWEAVIKVSLGKYPLSVSFEAFFQTGIAGGNMLILPIELRHAAVLSTLPMHHKDPFDRMILSQAIAEQIPIVSADSAFDAYPITRLW